MSIYGNPVMMGGGSSNIISKTITQNGVYNASSDDADGYNPVTVNVPSGGIPSGTTPPNPSTGSDGDLYVQIFPVASNVNFVEYLESSGTQYIDTGILISVDTGLSLAGISKGATSWLMGTRNASTIDSATVALAASFSNSTTFYSIKSFGSEHTFATCSASRGSRYNCKIKIAEDLGAKYALQSSSSGNSAASRVDKMGTGTSTYTIVLFGVNTSGTVTYGSSACICRVTIFEKNVPVADYLPCLDSNGVPCMWDNIAKEYIHNDGTGSFTYGSAVTPDELEPVLYQKVNGVWEVVS